MAGFRAVQSHLSGPLSGPRRARTSVPPLVITKNCIRWPSVPGLKLQRRRVAPLLSRARVGQIMNLLNLPVQIQESILLGKLDLGERLSGSSSARRTIPSIRRVDNGGLDRFCKCRVPANRGTNELVFCHRSREAGSPRRIQVSRTVRYSGSSASSRLASRMASPRVTALGAKRCR